ncbi:MAG: cation-transporting P-type ATPase [Stagnimonas sp.]|nr:cation-transporting P-type ATPase [Stagnimonas sp.]
MRHTVPPDRLQDLADDANGLSAEVAAERQQRHGSNDILGDAPAGWAPVLRDSARDPMIWFLAATAALFAWLGDLVEATVLASALLPILGMDAYLHRRTQASTEGLAGQLAARARVLRDGRELEIAAQALVPGDIAIIAASEAFPADGIIAAGTGLQVDESALSGEALPVRKRALARADCGASVEHEHWGSAGTRLLTGEARLRVIHTGSDTLYGEIVRLARAGQQERTPLQRAVGSLVLTLVLVAVVLCLVLAATRLVQGHGLVDALLSAVTLAIAAFPEEFPVVFTCFLGVGVYRLARRKALVRRAAVVENIGRVSCICSDKTGTLTEGRLRLEHLLPVTETGDAALLRAAALASRAESGDPMDLAILAKAGASDGGELMATFPFTEDRRRETAILRQGDGVLRAVTKGAPETVLTMTTLPDVERTLWLQRVLEYATSGHKVVACAERSLDRWVDGEPERDYRFLGLLAFEDPLRPGVTDAVAEAQAAGIRVIMVTGDHPATARAIAAELGLGANHGGPRVIEGAELTAQLQRGVSDGLRGVDVVARCLPAQKLELVSALRGGGDIVAVTGDGINDVPALRGADVGIAMGERGTRSAREVAAIVLLDDNFRSIVGAIAEGRQLFDTLRLSFAYLLMVHIPLVLTAAFIPLAGYPVLYLPIHIVWIELIIHPTALLVFQQLPSSGRLAPLRRSTRLRFFDRREWLLIASVGGLLALMVALAYGRSLGPDQDLGHARAMAMVMLVLGSAALTAALSRLRTPAAAITIAASLLSAVLLVQQPQLAGLLHLAPLHLDDWLIALLATALAGGLASLLGTPPRQPPVQAP